MKLPTYMFRDERRSGAAIIELTMVVPILALLLFGAIETARYHRAQQLMSAFSRELATNAYRGCLNQSGEVAACLDRLVSMYTKQMDTELEDVHVMVSLYRKGDRQVKFGLGDGLSGTQELLDLYDITDTVPSLEDGFSTNSFRDLREERANDDRNERGDRNEPGDGTTVAIPAVLMGFATTKNFPYQSEFEEEPLQQFQQQISSLSDEKPVVAIAEVWYSLPIDVPLPEVVGRYFRDRQLLKSKAVF